MALLLNSHIKDETISLDSISFDKIKFKLLMSSQYEAAFVNGNKEFKFMSSSFKKNNHEHLFPMFPIYRNCYEASFSHYGFD